MDKCTICNMKIIAFKNNDWVKRKMHKTCYQKKTTDFAYEFFMEDYIATTNNEQQRAATIPAKDMQPLPATNS